jgi:hypothetical protein
MLVLYNKSWFDLRRVWRYQMGNQNAYIVKLALCYNKIISLDTHVVSTFLFCGSEN